MYVHGLVFALVHRGSTDVVLDIINGVPFATPLVRRSGVVALVHHVHRAQWRIIYPGIKGRIGWWLESRLATWLYRGRPYVTVSKTSRSDLVAIGVRRDDLHIVPNGLTARPYLGGPIADRPPRIVVLARLVPHKHIEEVFVIAARIRAEFSGLGVDVVGEGWWRDHLVAAADQCRVSDLVTFHGRVSDDERDRLLAGARVMVLPSAKEGWGLAVSEAGAQGTPSVGYRRSGGLSESIIDGVTGRVVENLDGLVQAAAELLRGGAAVEEMSRAAREAARSLSWDESADALLGIVSAAADARAVSGRRR